MHQDQPGTLSHSSWKANRPAALHPPPRRRALRYVAVLAAICLLLPTGCSMVRDFEPQVDPDTLDATTFLHYVGTVPAVSVAEGCRAMLITADGEEKFETFETRYAELLSRGMVRQAWQLEPQHVLDKGTAAFMAFQICQLPGGVNTLLLGSWGLSDRRYALRELVAEGFMPYATPGESMRGGEMLALLARMDEHMAEHKLYHWGGQQVDSPEDVRPIPDHVQDAAPDAGG